MARSTNQAAAAQLRADSAKTPKVRWETSNLKSSYANVCSVSSTREEVIFNFGVNKAWERGADEVEVELTDRLILSPFAAKRMLMNLEALMREYEKRYGALDIGVPQPAAVAQAEGDGKAQPN